MLHQVNQSSQAFDVTVVQVFSDILTPLPAMGIEFDVIRGRGPIVLGDLARTLKEPQVEGRGTRK